MLTDQFDVTIPSPLTIACEQTLTVKAAVKVHPNAPLGTLNIRLPATTLFSAKNAVTQGDWQVTDAGSPLPLEIIDSSYALEGADANPFHPASDVVTRFRLRIAEEGSVRLKVYSLTGELVRVLVDESRPIGYYEEPWDGRNSRGERCASGIYLIRLEGANYATIKKLAIVK